LVTHLIPSGVLRPGVICVLGEGMVVDPKTLIDEIEGCKARGLLADDSDLIIAERSHVILGYHRDLDRLREGRAGAIGTTKRGIGPAYEAKVARRGVRMADLVRTERLRAVLERNLEAVNPELQRLGGEPYTVDALLPEATAYGARLSRYLGDAGRRVYDAVRR